MGKEGSFNGKVQRVVFRGVDVPRDPEEGGSGLGGCQGTGKYEDAQNNRIGCIGFLRRQERQERRILGMERRERWERQEKKTGP